MVRALHSLKKEENIVILPADKGKVIVIMDRGDYTYKMKQVPEDGKYKTLNRDPTVKIDKKIVQTLKQLKDEGHIDHRL